MANIRIPGWDDIVHITPRYKYTPAEQAEFDKKPLDRIWANISPEGIKEYERKCDAVRTMIDSPQPEIAKKVGSIMTMIDNFEDGLTTAAVAGRILCKVAPQMLGRFIPIVGWAFAATDALSLFNYLRLIPMTARGAKKRAFDIADANPLSKKSRAKGAVKAKKALHGKTFKKMAEKLPVLKKYADVIPSMPEMIEIAQTTDNLFGVGLCLGPIVGMVMDGLFGFDGKMRDSQKRTMKALTESGFSKPLINNPILASVIDAIGHETYGRMILGERLVTDAIKRSFEYYKFNEYEDGLNEVPIPVSVPSDPVTRAALMDHDVDPDTAIGFPFPDEPTELYPCELYYRTYEQNTENFQNYCLENTHSDLGYIVGSTGGEITDQFLEIYEDKGWSTKSTTADETRLIQICLESETLPPQDATDESVQQYFDRMLMFRDVKGRLPRGEDLKAICLEEFGEIGTFPQGEPVGRAIELFPEYEDFTEAEKTELKRWGMQFD